MPKRNRSIIPLLLLGLIALGLFLVLREEFGDTETVVAHAPPAAVAHAPPAAVAHAPPAAVAHAPPAAVSAETGKPVQPVPAPRDLINTKDPAVRSLRAEAVSWAKPVLAGLSDPALTMSMGRITPADQALIERVSDAGSKRIFRYGFVSTKGVLVLATRTDELDKRVVADEALAALKNGRVYAYPVKELFAELRADGSKPIPAVVVLVPGFEDGRFLGAVRVYVDSRPESGRR